MSGGKGSKYVRKGWYDMDLFYDIYRTVSGKTNCDYCIAWRMFGVGACTGVVISTIAVIVQRLI
jgi:hypothetical protein